MSITCFLLETKICKYLKHCFLQEVIVYSYWDYVWS